MMVFRSVQVVGLKRSCGSQQKKLLLCDSEVPTTSSRAGWCDSSWPARPGRGYVTLHGVTFTNNIEPPSHIDISRKYHLHTSC